MDLNFPKTYSVWVYYHILANDLKEAVEIAKSDPRFEDGKWKIEVRPIMKVEGIN